MDDPGANAGALRTNLGRVLRQRSAVIALAILAFLFSIAIFADFIAPYPETKSMLDLHEAGRAHARSSVHPHPGLPRDPA